MTEKEFEGLFKNTPELEPRAELKDEILARASKELVKKDGSKSKITSASPLKKIRLWIPIAACLVLVLLVAGGAFGLSNEKYTTVYIDVNPSVAISFNRFDKVSHVEYLNADAKTALDGVELEGESSEKALEAVVAAYDRLGYFESEAEMLISAEDDDQELLHRLKSHAEKIKGNKNYTVVTQSLTQEEKEFAKEMGMSPGKYRVISEIIEKDDSYTIDELKSLSMAELNKISKSLEKSNNKNQNKK